MIDRSPPAVSPDFFCDIKKQSEVFSERVKDRYAWTLSRAGIVPVFSDKRLSDAWHAYCWDRDRLVHSMPSESEPDHFKLSGHLAYWLRRFSPVIKYEEVAESSGQVSEEIRELIFEYGAEYLAFDLGYAICHHFAAPFPREPDWRTENTRKVCYFMKFKSVSPHALGLIYDAIFVLPRPGP